VCCYVWYSEEGPGRAAVPLNLLLIYICTKCNSPPINGQCTNFVLFDVAIKKLRHRSMLSGMFVILIVIFIIYFAWSNKDSIHIEQLM